MHLKRKITKKNLRTYIKNNKIFNKHLKEISGIEKSFSTYTKILKKYVTSFSCDVFKEKVEEKSRSDKIALKSCKN